MSEDRLVGVTACGCSVYLCPGPYGSTTVIVQKGETPIHGYATFRVSASAYAEGLVRDGLPAWLVAHRDKVLGQIDDR